MPVAPPPPGPPLVFGPVVIDWQLAGVRTPLGFPFELVDDQVEVLLVTLCELVCTREGLTGEIRVPKDFVFDGASIPQRYWSRRGFTPLGKKVWAALFHDLLCELVRQGKCDRVLADAVFAALLEHTGVETRKRTVMELGVALYRWVMKLLKVNK
jgi:hypothetical protein